jgi:hypothetical protein
LTVALAADPIISRAITGYGEWNIQQAPAESARLKLQKISGKNMEFIRF